MSCTGSARHRALLSPHQSFRTGKKFKGANHEYERTARPLGSANADTAFRADSHDSQLLDRSCDPTSVSRCRISKPGSHFDSFNRWHSGYNRYPVQDLLRWPTVDPLSPLARHGSASGSSPPQFRTSQPELTTSP